MAHVSKHRSDARSRRWLLAPALATTLAAPLITASSAQAAPVQVSGLRAAAPAMAHPGTSMTMRELKKRLDYAHYGSGKGSKLDKKTKESVRRFQRKFGLEVDGIPGPKTQAKLIEVTRRGYGLRPECLAPGKVLCVDKTLRLVRAMENGRILHSYDSRFGRKSLPTREGMFHVTRKGTDYDKDGMVSLEEAKRYVSRQYDASMPLPLFFSGGQAIHYSPAFKRDGYSAQGSHGCVNVRNYDGMEWMWTWAPVRTPVFVYWGERRR